MIVSHPFFGGAHCPLSTFRGYSRNYCYKLTYSNYKKLLRYFFIDSLCTWYGTVLKCTYKLFIELFKLPRMFNKNLSLNLMNLFLLGEEC